MRLYGFIANGQGPHSIRAVGWTPSANSDINHRVLIGDKRTPGPRYREAPEALTKKGTTDIK